MVVSAVFLRPVVRFPGSRFVWSAPCVPPPPWCCRAVVLSRRGSALLISLLDLAFRSSVPCPRSPGLPAPASPPSSQAAAREARLISCPISSAPIASAESQNPRPPRPCSAIPDRESDPRTSCPVVQGPKVCCLTSCTDSRARVPIPDQRTGSSTPRIFSVLNRDPATFGPANLDCEPRTSCPRTSNLVPSCPRTSCPRALDPRTSNPRPLDPSNLESSNLEPRTSNPRSCTPRPSPPRTSNPEPRTPNTRVREPRTLAPLEPRARTPRPRPSAPHRIAHRRWRSLPAAQVCGFARANLSHGPLNRCPSPVRRCRPGRRDVVGAAGDE